MLACKIILLTFHLWDWYVSTSITLKLVPVGLHTKIHVSECKVATLFQDNLSQTHSGKLTPHTPNSFGGKINFLIF